MTRKIMIVIIATVIAGQAAEFKEVNGIVAMEAEHATTSNGWKAINGGMEDGGSGGLSFKITFSKTGNYYLWVRGATAASGCPPSTSGNDCFVNFDNKALLLKDYTGSSCVIGLRWSNGGCKIMQWQQGCKPCPNPKDWSQINSLPVYVKVTSAGTHTLNILHRSTGLMIDRAVMQLDNSAKPSGVGPAETVLGPTGVATKSLYAPSTLTIHKSTMYSLQGAAISGNVLRKQIGVFLTSDSRSGGLYIDAIDFRP